MKTKPEHNRSGTSTTGYRAVNTTVAGEQSQIDPLVHFHFVSTYQLTLSPAKSHKSASITFARTIHAVSIEKYVRSGGVRGTTGKGKH